MEHALKNRLPQPGRRFRDGHLAQAWLILVLAVFFGIALAAVQVNLSGIILKNRQHEALDRVPELVWGAAGAQQITAQNTPVEIIPGSLKITSDTKTEIFTLFKVIREKQLAGWVIKAGGQGYADKIDLLIGVDPEVKKLTGLFILNQKETPGLGNKIASAEWRRQFAGKPTDRPLAVVNGSPGGGRHTVDAITGATISSRSVIRIVNRVMAATQAALATDPGRFSERRK